MFKLQNVIFPKESICNEEELFFRKIGIPISNNLNEDSLEFVKKQRINFDTYFNSFSLLKWYTYAGVNNVHLNLSVKGKFVVRLIHYTIRDNRQLDWRIIREFQINSDGRKEEFSFEYITEHPFGLLAFGLEALEDDSILYGGYYSTKVNKERIRDVKIGLGICTYRREQYVFNNMKNLCKSILNNRDSKISNKIEVFISDNAGTLLNNNFQSEKIHIFKNKNTGGSGGFARTMIEVNKANSLGEKFTHILLMDDDVIFEPESIYRTYAILSLVKEEYKDSFVGGAMFFVDQKYIQHANGEYWHGERYESFITTYNLDRDMRRLDNITENEHLTNANYQAWWYCAIPMSICRMDNLSLPLFIKSDDIEFSIRNLKNLITINGIAVWHEAFETKYAASNEYYTVRNYLITSSIHNINLTPNDIKTYVKNYTMHYLSNFKYLEIELFYKAISDFFKGVDYLKSIDLETYHKEIMKNGYKMQNIEELGLPFSEELYHQTLCTPYPKSKLKRMFRIITLNGLLLPSKKVVALGMWGGSHIQTYRAKYIIRYEPKNKKAFVLQRSLSKFVKSMIAYFKIMSEIDKKYLSAKKEFADRYEELINIDFWKEKL